MTNNHVEQFHMLHGCILELVERLKDLTLHLFLEPNSPGHGTGRLPQTLKASEYNNNCV